MRKVLIVGEGGQQYCYPPFSDFGKYVGDSEILWEDPHSVSLVVFTGGADVSPCLYGQEAAYGTFCHPRRDIFEIIAFEKALKLKLPMAGICRGAQFLNIMAGGKMCQHLDGHGGQPHLMTTVDDVKFMVSSTHHQMMLPPEDAHVVGWSTERNSKGYWGENGNRITPKPEKEYEVIYWPSIRAVGMQYHPESMPPMSQGFSFARELVKKYLKVKPAT